MLQRHFRPISRALFPRRLDSSTKRRLQKEEAERTEGYSSVTLSSEEDAQEVGEKKHEVALAGLERYSSFLCALAGSTVTMCPGYVRLDLPPRGKTSKLQSL